MPHTPKSNLKLDKKDYNNKQITVFNFGIIFRGYYFKKIIP